MKCFLPTIFALGLGLTGLALSQNVVPMPFTKVPGSSHSFLSKIKSNAVGGDESLTDLGYFYLAAVAVGTPPQFIELDIDTGSSDTWVFDANSSANGCGSGYDSSAFCTGVFSPSMSESYQPLDNDTFLTGYVSGAYASGIFFEDTFSIAGFNITGMQIALATNATGIENGLIGLSYPSQEGGISLGEPIYPTLIDNLVSQHLINAPTFSLWLNGGEDDKGMLLFGGIDTDKFSGELHSTPIQPIPASLLGPTTFSTTPQAFFVNITYFGFGDEGLSAPAPETAVLDSGSSLMYLPQAMIEPMTIAYSATYDQGYYFVDCDITDMYPTDYLEFQFAAMPCDNGTESPTPTIRVPITDFVVDNSGFPVGNASGYDAGAQCILGFASTEQSEGTTILGDVFLRNAYVVYDMKNGVIGLAQTASNSNTSSIVEIGANATSIPTLCGTNGQSSCSINVQSVSVGSASSSGNWTGTANITTGGIPPSSPTSGNGMNASQGSSSKSLGLVKQIPGSSDLFGVLALIVSGLVFFS